MQGSVKFGDAGPIIFVTKTDECRLLMGNYNIPTLRKSIMQQLEKNRSHMEIKHNMVHIWN